MRWRNQERTQRITSCVGLAGVQLFWLTSLAACDRSPTLPPQLVASAVGPDQQHAQPNPTADFPLFDAMHFRGKPNTAPLGFRRIAMLYASSLWPQNAKDRSQPDETHIATQVASLPSGVPVCLDIEHWKLDDAHLDATVAKLIRVIRAAKRARPDLKFGFYSLLPSRNFWAATADPASQRHKQWLKRNRRLKPLANEVDLIFPSLYAFYPDQKSWALFAQRTLQEARRYGKPVYPFLWPQYHGLDKKKNNPWVEEPYWASQLQTCLQGADGLVLWGPAWTPWDDQAPWWNQTQRFADQLSATQQ